MAQSLKVGSGCILQNTEGLLCESVLIMHRVAPPDIRQQAFVEAASYLKKAGIGKGKKFEFIGKKAIQELAKKEDKTMTLDEFTSIIQNEKLADELLQENVFSHNVVNQTVNFQSRLMEVYVMENQQMFG